MSDKARPLLLSPDAADAKGEGRMGSSCDEELEGAPLGLVGMLNKTLVGTGGSPCGSTPSGSGGKEGGAAAPEEEEDPNMGERPPPLLLAPLLTRLPLMQGDFFLLFKRSFCWPLMEMRRMRSAMGSTIVPCPWSGACRMKPTPVPDPPLTLSHPPPTPLLLLMIPFLVLGEEQPPSPPPWRKPPWKTFSVWLALTLLTD